MTREESAFSRSPPPELADLSLLIFCQEARGQPENKSEDFVSNIASMKVGKKTRKRRVEKILENYCKLQGH